MENIFDLSYQQNDLDSKLIVALNKLSQVLRLLLWDKSNQLRLSPLQIQLLIHIYTHDEEEARVTALARRFSLTKATVSDAISALERRGLVARRVLDEDRRAARIELTDKARTLLDEMSNWPLPLKQILADFDAGSKSQTLRFLMELISSLEKAGLIHPSRMCLSCRFYRPPAGEGGQPYCEFLERELTPPQLRLDCPDYQRAAETTALE